LFNLTQTCLVFSLPGAQLPSPAVTQFRMGNTTASSENRREYRAIRLEA
jgi:hypothetical protein